ncbi:hypothetical protein Btru_065751, partial [Bulinus truncatus]
MSGRRGFHRNGATPEFNMALVGALGVGKSGQAVCPPDQCIIMTQLTARGVYFHSGTCNQARRYLSKPTAPSSNDVAIQPWIKCEHSRDDVKLIASERRKAIRQEKENSLLVKVERVGQIDWKHESAGFKF